MADYNARLAKGFSRGRVGDAERREPSRTTRAKARRLAQLMKSAHHCVMMTGAGISCAEPAGIPDFRGPHGVWTYEKQGKQIHPFHVERARPTKTHMAIVELVKVGIVKHVVSQNIDGLHLLSGLPRTKVSEPHGNTFAEVCEKCQIEFIRSKDVCGMNCQLTGNSCDYCGTPLRDTVIDWITPLSPIEVQRIHTEMSCADLVVVVGSSLRVRPAFEWPLLAIQRKQSPGKLVIVNLQTTDFDEFCELRIFADSDAVFKILMEEVRLQIPTWERPQHFLPYNRLEGL